MLGMVVVIGVGWGGDGSWSGREVAVGLGCGVGRGWRMGVYGCIEKDKIIHHKVANKT